ncbi:hypothetical protein [Terrarubrum flagellatum]|uniref:hypothetical protein n=1 Tax=Terrirubrum flagellatum TaxID=2895980 RepID=UPI0031452851
MLGRITKTIICVGAITAMSTERDVTNDLKSLAANAPQAAMVQAQAACAADPDRCVSALRTISDLIALTTPQPSRDTLTASDRAAAPLRRGG